MKSFRTFVLPGVWSASFILPGQAIDTVNLSNYSELRTAYLEYRDWLNKLLPFALALPVDDIVSAMNRNDYSFLDDPNWYYTYTLTGFQATSGGVLARAVRQYGPLGVYEDLSDNQLHVVNGSGDLLISLAAEPWDGVTGDAATLFWEFHKRSLVLWFEFETASSSLPASASAFSLSTLSSLSVMSALESSAAYGEFEIVDLLRTGDDRTGLQLVLGLPAYFTNRCDIYSYDGDLCQASNGWQLAAAGLVACDADEIVWTEQDQLGRTPVADIQRRYYRAGNADLDEDGDGYSSAYEKLVLGTSPTNSDTDADGVSDGPFDPDGSGSIVFGPDAFPLDAAASVDSDGDGMPDALSGTSALTLDGDDDNDGISDSSDPEPTIPGITAPFKVVTVLSTNYSSADSGTEVFDVSASGRMLPYADGGNAGSGFGRLHGGIYFNHDGTNLYIGVAGYSKTEITDGDDALLLLLDSKSGGVSGLNAIGSGPRGLSVCDNLLFQAGTFEPDTALLLGCRYADGCNNLTVQLGGREFGQGVYSLSGGTATHLTPSFTASGPSPISQWGDSPYSTNLANAGIEVAIPLSNLLETAWSSTSTTIIYAAAIVVGGDDGTRRYLSTEVYGESVSGSFGYSNTTLIGAAVCLSAQAAPEPNSTALFGDGDVMIQAFGWDVSRPLSCYFSNMTVAGTFNGWNTGLNNMTPIGDDTWEYIRVFTNETGVEFKFVAANSWSSCWGATNQADTTLPMTNQYAPYTTSAAGNIAITGTVTGSIRFRFNTGSQIYSVEAVSNGTPTKLLAGYSDIRWYEQLERQVESNDFDRFVRVWMPPPQKGKSGKSSVGYDPYDYYDLGTYNQKGTVATRYGTEAQLKACVNAFAARNIDCMADMVLNHMNGGDTRRYDYEYGSHNMFEKANAGTTDTNDYFNVDYADYPFRFDHGFGLPDGVSASDAYPAADSADVNELHPYMRNGIKNWANWLESKVSYRGCRFDFTQGMQPGFFAEFMNTPLMKGRFAVSEYWTNPKDASAREHETWIRLMDRRSCSFDMPLHEKLQYMCNRDGAFDMEELTSGALIHSDPAFAVTFVESHDTIRPFKGGNKIGIEQNKELAYAFILFSEGLPCVFYQDYFGQPYADEDSETGWSGTAGELKPYIDAMIEVRAKYAGGTTTYLSTANKTDLFIARRNGTEEKDGCILVLNDHMSSSLTNTVNTGWTQGTVLVDALNTNHTVTVQADGLAALSAPARAYRVYVRQQAL